MKIDYSELKESENHLYLKPVGSWDTDPFAKQDNLGESDEGRLLRSLPSSEPRQQDKKA
jgi:hypothetical protein